MTIAGSLNNALSGLTATARATEVVSSNVANANTPGYATRQLEVSSQYLGGTTGGGVKVNGVVRNVDQGVINDRVLSDASAGHDSALSAFLNDLEGILARLKRPILYPVALPSSRQPWSKPARAPPTAKRALTRCWMRLRIWSAISMARPMGFSRHAWTPIPASRTRLRR